MSTKLLKRLIRQSLRGRLVRDSRGEATIETAMIVFALSLILLGVVDFSMAFSKKSEMSNAVRAGVQFALARHPSIGPSVTTSESLISIQQIRDAVVNSASFLSADPGSPALDVTLFCQCPDTTPVTCAPDPGVTLPCSTRRTYMQITLRTTYDPIIHYPGVLDTALNLESTGSVRLN